MSQPALLVFVSFFHLCIRALGFLGTWEKYSLIGSFCVVYSSHQSFVVLSRSLTHTYTHRLQRTKTAKFKNDGKKRTYQLNASNMELKISQSPDWSRFFGRAWDPKRQTVAKALCSSNNIFINRAIHLFRHFVLLYPLTQQVRVHKRMPSHNDSQPPWGDARWVWLWWTDREKLPCNMGLMQHNIHLRLCQVYT